MVQLIGKIAKDAITTQVSEGKHVINFVIALNDSYRRKNGEVVKEVTYIRCSYWKKSNVAAFLTEGKIVEVWARLEADKYTNKTGEIIPFIKAHVQQLILHGGGSKANTPTDDSTTLNAMDDLPF